MGKPASPLTMLFDGNGENAFPWMSSTSDNRDQNLPMSPGIPKTPGFPMSPGLLSPGYFAGAVLPKTPGVTPTPGLYPSTPGNPPLTPGAPVHNDPPRPPREGFEWVWFPEGFWAERELIETSPPSSKGDKFLSSRRWKGKSSSTKSQSSNDYSDQPFPLPSPRRGSGSRRGSGGSIISPQPYSSHTSFRTEKDLIQSLQAGPAWTPTETSSDGTPVWHSPAFGPSGTPTEGSVHGSSPSSTIRGFRRGSWPEGTPTIPEERDEDVTGSITPLSRLKSIGKGKEQKRKAKSQETDEPSPEPLAKSEPVSPRKDEQTGARKWFAKVSWRKKEPANESPILTQIDEEPYVSKRFWTAAYPGGEARRVTTPPLKEAKAEGKVRSLFSEVDNFTDDDPDHDHHDRTRSEGDNRSDPYPSNSNSPGTGTETASTSSTKSSSKINSAYRKAAASEGKVRHWFDQISEDDPHKKERKREKREKREKFHLSVPEHLPNSPLCPANEKHASGGLGVCVYHGRRHEPSKPTSFKAELGMQQPGSKS